MPVRKGLFQLLAELRRDNLPCALATVIEVSGSTSGRLGDKAVYSPEGRRLAGWIGGGCVERLAGEAAVKVMQTGRSEKLPVNLDGSDPLFSVPCGGEMTVLVEPIPARPVLMIIGSGRLVEALTDMARLLEFNIVVQTDKDNATDFPAAHRVATDPLDWDQLDPLPDYLVLASHHPDEGLFALQGLQRGIPYVALVASRKRTAVITKFLTSNGLSKADIAKLRAPAGLDIGADGPQEISLSILAEIVLHRSGGSGTPLASTAKK